MYRAWIVLIAAAGAALALTTPAMAAPAACSTSGESGVAALAFPKGDNSDAALARAMIPALEAGLGAPPAGAACLRGEIQTAGGAYRLGGENTDAWPRVARRADGGAGPIAYLARPNGQATYALALIHPNGIVAAYKFYAVIPGDAVLRADIQTALAAERYLVAVRRAPLTPGDAVPLIQVSYGYLPPGAAPPPVQTGPRPDGTTVEVGPQILTAEGSSAFMQPSLKGIFHPASNATCPNALDNNAILLMYVEAEGGSLTCNYRKGPDMKYDPQAEIRYQWTMDRLPGLDLAAAFAQQSAGARRAFPVESDRTVPLPAAASGQSAFFNIRGGATEGVWMGKIGDWIIRLRASYPAPASPANDAEAARVAKALFDTLPNVGASRP